MVIYIEKTVTCFIPVSVANAAFPRGFFSEKSKKIKGKSHRKAKIKTYVQSIKINGWFIIVKLTLITLSYKRTPTLRIFGLVK